MSLGTARLPALVPPPTELPPAAAALRADVRAFLAEERAAGLWRPRPDVWLSGWDERFTRELDEIYPNHASAPRGTPIGAWGTEPGDWAAGTVTIDATRAQEYLTEKPWRRTYFVLDRLTGAEREIAPTRGPRKASWRASTPGNWVLASSGKPAE